MTAPTELSCPLCALEQLERQIVTETANFLLLAVGEPLTEGHLLLAPRVHAPCLAALPPEMDSEMLRLKERAVRMLAETFTPPALFEVCDRRDKGAHAHLHAVPGAPDLLEELSAGERSIPVVGLEELRTAGEALPRYLYWELGSSRALIADEGGLRAQLMGHLTAALTPPARQGREAAHNLRRLWQRRMAAAGEPVEVVACVLRRGEHVCLLQRSFEQDSAPGLWHVVSGYLPDGAEPLEQALREVEQEAGLWPAQVRLARAGRPLTFGGRAIGQMWRIHPFLFDLLEGEPRLNWEHVDLAWVRPSETWQYPCVPWLPSLVEGLVREGPPDH